MDQLLKDVTLTKEQRLELEHIRLQADSYSADELDELFAKYDVTALATGNPLTHTFPFNLMFSTQIGPEGTLQGFLRPETAQGMFMNYRRLLDYNGRKFPFAAAQVVFFVYVNSQWRRLNTFAIPRIRSIPSSLRWLIWYCLCSRVIISKVMVSC